MQTVNQVVQALKQDKRLQRIIQDLGLDPVLLAEDIEEQCQREGHFELGDSPREEI